jgi:hypothetical protein
LFSRRGGRVAEDGVEAEYDFTVSKDLRYTISDYVRELHADGVEPRMICWRLKLKPETVEKWLDIGDKGL